jgi:FdhD protein
VTLNLRTTTRPVTRFATGAWQRADDAIAVERPLEIRVDGRALAVTLRTPGNDRELALGFLAAERVIRTAAEVRATTETLAACTDEPDVLEIALAAGVPLDWSKLERHFASTSACGLCGRAHLDALRAGLVAIPESAPIAPEALLALPERARTTQVTFAATGGLHAAAYAGTDLDVQVLREDVGRHNAVDKVCGWLLDQARYPVDGGVLWVSGRAGAEIVLKAARARIPVLAAVGAPSSLAIELAEAARMTLVGFLREGRMNVYSGPERIGATSRRG